MSLETTLNGLCTKVGDSYFHDSTGVEFTVVPNKMPEEVKEETGHTSPNLVVIQGFGGRIEEVRTEDSKTTKEIVDGRGVGVNHTLEDLKYLDNAERGEQHSPFRVLQDIFTENGAQIYRPWYHFANIEEQAFRRRDGYKAAMSLEQHRRLMLHKSMDAYTSGEFYSIVMDFLEDRFVNSLAPIVNDAFGGAGEYFRNMFRVRKKKFLGIFSHKVLLEVSDEGEFHNQSFDERVSRDSNFGPIDITDLQYDFVTANRLDEIYPGFVKHMFSRDAKNLPKEMREGGSLTLGQDTYLLYPAGITIPYARRDRFLSLGFQDNPNKLHILHDGFYASRGKVNLR